MADMPADGDWALIAPYADKTLIHNAFIYSLGREMGLEAPRLAFVEVYLNTANRPLSADDYQGVYLLTETIKNQSERLDLCQLEPDDTDPADITGGYIFKFEWMATEEPTIACPGGAETCWSDMELVDPDDISIVQMNWLTDHLAAFNDALHGASPGDPATGYPAFIDRDSFIDHIIVQELGRNMDAFVRSQYFFKDRDALIHAGPLWDYDLIAGVGSDPMPYFEMYANRATDGFQYQTNATRMTSDWFDVLLTDGAFLSALTTRWRELRGGLLSDSAISGRIADLSAGLEGGAQRNFNKWPILSQASVGPFTTPTDATWQGQLTSMENWLHQRAAWLDTQW